MNINLDSERYGNIDPRAMGLLRKMLVAKPSERISASQALSHDYFEGMYVESDEKQFSPCPTKGSEKKGNRLLFK